MNTKFSNTTDLPLEEARRLPEKDWFTPDHIERDKEKQHIKSTASDHETLVVSDTDADGLGCVAIAEAALDDVGYIPAGPHGPTLDFAKALTLLADHTDSSTSIYICDISPNKSDWINVEPAFWKLAENTNELIWCDHHNYPPEIHEEINAITLETRISDSETECATSVLYNYLTDTYNPSWATHIEDLVTVTRDRDCWILDDPRNQDLADFATIASPMQYINIVYAYGPDLTPKIHDELSTYRTNKRELVDLALTNTSIHELDVHHQNEYPVDTLRIATVYGRCPSSDTAESIRNEHDAHAVVMVKPSGAVSLRGSDTFENCSEIAEQFDGGGHDRAAGCYPADLLFDSMLDFAAHWQSNGQDVTQALLQAVANQVTHAAN